MESLKRSILDALPDQTALLALCPGQQPYEMEGDTRERIKEISMGCKFN